MGWNGLMKNDNASDASIHRYVSHMSKRILFGVLYLNLCCVAGLCCECCETQCIFQDAYSLWLPCVSFIRFIHVQVPRTIISITLNVSPKILTTFRFTKKNCRKQIFYTNCRPFVQQHQQQRHTCYFIYLQYINIYIHIGIYTNLLLCMGVCKTKNNRKLLKLINNMDYLCSSCGLWICGMS